MARCFSLVLVTVLVATIWANATSANDFCNAAAFGDQTKSPTSYGRRAGGYCDGAVYEQHSGSGELSVIGLTAAPIEGSPGSTPLHITALVPSHGNGVDAGELHLCGVAKSPTLNYRLDAGLSVSRGVTVGPESAMFRLVPPLLGEDVAWTAWVDSSTDGRTYFPVVPFGSSGHGVEITVRPTIPTAYVLYSVMSDSGQELAPEQKVQHESYELGEPVAFSVGASAPVVLVKVIAVGNGGRTQVARIRLSHPGSSE